jgi:hypothetical protein
MKGKVMPMLTCVLSKRKTNQNGRLEGVYVLQHLTDPYQCPWFAFAYELFCQVHIDGFPFAI